jgi:hypothetical protein
MIREKILMIREEILKSSEKALHWICHILYIVHNKFLVD